MLEFTSAMSGSVDGQRAVSECFDIAFEGGEADCDLIMFHTTVGHDFETLLATIRKRCPDAKVAGCTCAGVIGKEGANETLKGLAMIFVKGPATDFHITHSDNIRGENSRAEAERMGHELEAALGKDVHTVYLLASGIDIAADQAIGGLEAALGKDVRVIGGTSSDNMQAQSTFQFFGEQVFERGAVAVGIADPTLELVQGAHHGSVPVGRPFEVTRSEGNRVYELEGKPGWPVLMEALGQPEDSHPGPMIPIAGVGVEVTGEQRDANDNPHILRVIAKTEADGSFYLPVDVPEGTKLTLMERDESLIFSGLEGLIGRLREQTGDRTPVAVLHTDCAARGRFLFGRVMKDEIVARMQHPLTGGKPVPWLGMYGFGEFTELAGHNEFHNYTTSLYCLMRK
ncbi:MAG: FIST signal transduction protein [Nannocystales bacterium]